MLNIPASFGDKNEDYITLPAIRKFMKSHDIKSESIYLREELLNKITEYGNKSDMNAESVLDWIDEVIQEGIKDIYIKFSPVSEKMELMLNNSDKLLNYINSYVDKTASKHICQNQCSENFKLLNAYIEESSAGSKMVFIYCKKLFIHDQKNRHTKTIMYPVIAEYYINNQWLLVKAKPKSNLYIFNNNGFNLDTAISTTTEKQISEIIGKIEELLCIDKIDKRSISARLKNQIFCLLDKYTTTPQEIVDVMSTKEEQISIISNMVKNICTVPDKCSIPVTIQKDIDEDIKNIIEKYLSINWKDKNTFIKDREAYPVKLSATDEEESKVEQTAAFFEPLQTKALFFDNKKMLYKNQSCDGVIFKWMRKDPAYFPKDMFTVKMSVNQKGLCVFKFSEYTVKEDIENVIFSIIGVVENTESTSDRASEKLC